MWSNNRSSYDRPISSHSLTLRDVMGSDSAGSSGLTCQRLYLDQVVIMFRPTIDISLSEFASNDGSQYNWHVETTNLLVRTRPGQENAFYVVDQSQSASGSTYHKPHNRLLYSNAYTVAPQIEGSEDYWCRTYRPVRDYPVAVQLQNVAELTVDLFYPMLYNGVLNNFQVPDYRILDVICDFTIEE